MSIPEDSLKGGLDYIAGRVESGDVYIIDVGRDRIHDDPLIISTWDENTNEENKPFSSSVFSERYLAHDFTPDENVRVAYDHGVDVVPGDQIGRYSNVNFFDVDIDQRLEFREVNEEIYEPDEQALEDLYELIN